MNRAWNSLESKDAPPPVAGMAILHRPLFHVVLLTLLAYPLFFHQLGRRDLWSSHEARAAQNAQQILDSGCWRLPQLYDGRVELQKPPLYYWLAAAAAQMTGGEVNAWAVRLPAALSAWLCVLLVYAYLASRGRPAAGLFAGLMLATSVHYTWLGRVARIDMPLTLAVTLALTTLFAGTRAMNGGSRLRGTLLLAAGYLSISAAVLLKGLIGPVLIAAGAAAWLWFERDSENDRPQSRRTWRCLHNFGVWWGAPLVLAVAGPWFWLANEETGGELLRVFFYRHTFQRGLGGDELLDRRGHPWWFYLAHAPSDLLPWTLILPLACWQWIRCRGWTADADTRFGVSWFGGMLVLLSCLQFKRADYLLPAFPGAAIALSCALERWLAAADGIWRRRSLSAFGLGVAGCVFGWIVYTEAILPAQEPRRELRTFADTIRRHAGTSTPVVMFRTESHPLTFHLGRPVLRYWEWENIDTLACREEPYYVVMPAEWAAQWPQFLEAGRLYPVLSNVGTPAGSHEQPLVLMCTQPLAQ